MRRGGILSEYLYFIKKERKWFLIPLILILLLFGAIFAVLETSALAPFIYPLF